jgi:leucyl aminopeptidase
MVRRAMRVTGTSDAPESTEADTIAIGAFSGEHALAGAPPEVAAMLDSGEARTAPGSVAVAHAAGKRWIVAGLGAQAEFTPERARAAAAHVRARAKEIATRSLCWRLPGDANGAVAAALVEGTVLADYSFRRFKTAEPAEDEAPAEGLDALFVAGDADLGETVSDAALVATAVNSARDLQNRPGNDLTPSALAEHARSLAREIDALEVEVEGREGLRERGMGAFAAVAQGSEQEPALITLRYDPPSTSGPTVGFVGKAVTFDSGGISLKPGAKMSEMKFDMSGGAAVLEASAAIARLGLPLRLRGVVGATENLPSGRSVKPGDIVTASNGKTIEVNNTDAEGRLVLADCLCHAAAEGSETLIDLATLTGAVIIALGSTYAGLMCNDDALAERIAAAGERTGEIVWRLPLHDEYRKLVKGTFADLDNAPEARKAGTIVGGTFLENFAGGLPWAHLDIAGSAWDLGRPYVGKGASGYGVRLLVELARSFCA